MCINKQVHKLSQVINNQCIISVQAKVLKEDSSVITQHPIIEQITSFNHKFYNFKLNYSQSSDQVELKLIITYSFASKRLKSNIAIP